VHDLLHGGRRWVRVFALGTFSQNHRTSFAVRHQFLFPKQQRACEPLRDAASAKCRRGPRRYDCTSINSGDLSSCSPRCLNCPRGRPGPRMRAERSKPWPYSRIASPGGARWLQTKQQQKQSGNKTLHCSFGELTPVHAPSPVYATPDNKKITQKATPSIKPTTNNLTPPLQSWPCSPKIG